MVWRTGKVENKGLFTTTEDPEYIHSLASILMQSSGISPTFSLLPVLFLKSIQVTLHIHSFHIQIQPPAYPRISDTESQLYHTILYKGIELLQILLFPADTKEWP